MLAAGAFAPADATTIQLSQGLPFSNVRQLLVSANGNRVVYVQDAVIDRAHELWSVPTGGGAPVRLSGLLLATGLYQENPFVLRHRDFWIAPGSNRVVYADASQHELRSVPIGGGPAVSLTAGLTGGAWGLSFSADAQWVVYLSGDPARIYSVPVTGGAPRQLNGAMVGGGAVRQFAISPSSQWVVYAADQQIDEVVELYAVPIADGPVVKLSPPMVPGGGVSAAPLLISADSSRVVYSADQEANDRTELWSVALTGGAATKLNGPLVAGGDVRWFVLTGPTATVVYEADQNTDQSWELFAAPVAGGGSRRVSRAPRGLNPGPQDNTLAALTPDGTRAIYLQRSLEGTGFSQLETETLLSTLLATGVSTVVSPTAQRGAGERLRSATATPDPTRVVYVFSTGQGGEDEVFLTDF